MDPLPFFKEVSYRPDPGFFKDFREALYSTKVVYLTGVPSEMDLTELYVQLAQHSGGFLNKNENLETAQMQADQWLDIRYDPRFEYTFRHSNTRQPLHTDGSYTDLKFDVIFFFCVEQADWGGATTFIDSKEVIELLKAVNPNLLNQLSTTEVDFVKGENQYKRAKIIDFSDGSVQFNWNNFRVSATNPPEVIAMAEAFHGFCENRMVDGGLMTPIRLLPGEAVFFHDRRVLHGRNSFWGNRCLMKGAISLTPATA